MITEMTSPAIYEKNLCPEDPAKNRRPAREVKVVTDDSRICLRFCGNMGKTSFIFLPTRVSDMSANKDASKTNHS